MGARRLEGHLSGSHSSKSGKAHSKSGKGEDYYYSASKSGKGEDYYYSASKSGKGSHSKSGKSEYDSHSSKSGKGSHSKSGKSGSSKSGKAHSKSGKSEDYYYSYSKSGKSSTSMDYHPECDFTCTEERLLVCAGFFHDAGAYCDGTSDCGGAMCGCEAGEYFCTEGKNPCEVGWS